MASEMEAKVGMMPTSTKKSGCLWDPEEKVKIILRPATEALILIPLRYWIWVSSLYTIQDSGHTV